MRPPFSRLQGSRLDRGRCRRSVLDWPVERNRARIDHWRRRLGLDRLERTVVDEEFVKHVLDRRLGLIGTGIAHVVMLETGIDDRNSSLLAYLLVRNDARVRVEDRVVGAERGDIEVNVRDKGK